VSFRIGVWLPLSSMERMLVFACPLALSMWNFNNNNDDNNERIKIRIFIDNTHVHVGCCFYIPGKVNYVISRRKDLFGFLDRTKKLYKRREIRNTKIR
jgi:hypothetical protein